MSTQEISSAFDQCVERKLMKGGSLEIHCKNMLWAVSGIDHEKVEGEAETYNCMTQERMLFEAMMADPRF